MYTKASVLGKYTSLVMIIVILVSTASFLMEPRSAPLLHLMIMLLLLHIMITLSFALFGYYYQAAISSIIVVEVVVVVVVIIVVVIVAMTIIILVSTASFLMEPRPAPLVSLSY